MRKNKILSIDVDSALVLIQEIYNDIAVQKNTATIITKKMLTFMKDSADMTIIGPVIKDQQKLLNDCIEKKISLVKLQSVLLKQTTGTGATGSGFQKMTFTDEDKKLLEGYMEDIDNSNEEGTYKK